MCICGRCTRTHAETYLGWRGGGGGVVVVVVGVGSESYGLDS